MSTNGLVHIEFFVGSQTAAVVTNWPFQAGVYISEVGSFALSATAVYQSGRRVSSPVRIIETQETGDPRGRLGVPIRERDRLLLVPYELTNTAGQWFLRGRPEVPFGANGVFEAVLAPSVGRFPILPAEPTVFMYLDKRF
jgi:hypothetical protein